MRLRVPWSELAALLAGYIVVATWSAANAPITPLGAGVAVLAVLAALVPRRALTGPAPASAEAASIAGALASLAIAPTVAGEPPTYVLKVVRAVATGESLALASALALALPLQVHALRRAIVPALAIGAVGLYGLWPHAVSSPAIRACAPLAAVATAFAFAHAVRRPHATEDRARLIAPGLGAAALALASLASTAWGAHATPLVMAFGLHALVLGMTLGTGAIALDRAARFAREVLSAAAGVAVGAWLSWSTRGVFAGLGPLAGVAVALGARPVLERWLRPEQGALLDACDAIVRALPTVQDRHDLASAVLDPLREAAHDLRAPAALWVLDRQEVLKLDVAGSASASPLSPPAERAILAWLRARPRPVFADPLRAHLVRRPELRPVVAALDEHGALGAVPLHEDGELAGVILVPRGRRLAAPTFEEEARLSEVARAVGGILVLVRAAERASERAREAHALAASAEASRVRAEAERDRLGERDRGRRAWRAVGSLEEEWVGYSTAMRALARDAARVAAGRAPVSLVSEPGAGALAVARAIHAKSADPEGPFVVLDAGSVHPRDALSTLVGDARGEVARPGWLEHARGGTLVVEDLPALGHDALLALVDAARTGTARRLGGEQPYETRVRLVVVTRVPLSELDVPASLIAQTKDTALRVPPLRNRLDDLETLVLAGLDRACRVAGRPTLGIAPDALVALRGYNWPGNVRELFDALDHAVARARGSRVRLEDLPPHLRLGLGVAHHIDFEDYEEYETPGH